MEETLSLLFAEICGHFCFEKWAKCCINVSKLWNLEEIGKYFCEKLWFGTENVSICPLFAHFCKTRKPLVSLGLRHFLPTFPLFFYTIIIKKLIYIKSLSKKSGHVSTRVILYKYWGYAIKTWTIMKGEWLTWKRRKTIPRM